MQLVLETILLLYTEISSKISSFFGGGSSSEEEPTPPPSQSEDATEEPGASESTSSKPAPEDKEQGTINHNMFICQPCMPIQFGHAMSSLVRVHQLFTYVHTGCVHIDDLCMYIEMT